MSSKISVRYNKESFSPGATLSISDGSQVELDLHYKGGDVEGAVKLFVDSGFAPDFAILEIALADDNGSLTRVCRYMDCDELGKVRDLAEALLAQVSSAEERLALRRQEDADFAAADTRPVETSYEEEWHPDPAAQSRMPLEVA